jgi:peptidyl-prolyl cis-trans isomerase C
MAIAEPIAEVNGQSIDAKVLDQYAIKRLGVAPTVGFPEEKRLELIEELIHRELIVQDAKRLEMDKDEEVSLKLQEVIKNTLLQLRIEKLLQENDPSEDQLQSLYKEYIVDKSSEEYKARHILLKTKKEAKAIIAELDKGAIFAKLAKNHSEGPSKNQGGDLGWFSLNQMVKPFADEVAKLKNGTYSKHPVKTRFGWHVIYREDSRKVDPPSFESVQKQVLEIAQNQIISEYIEKLKDEADIKLH